MSKPKAHFILPGAYIVGPSEGQPGPVRLRAEIAERVCSVDAVFPSREDADRFLLTGAVPPRAAMDRARRQYNGASDT